jgi:hypothetical protein
MQSQIFDGYENHGRVDSKSSGSYGRKTCELDTLILQSSLLEYPPYREQVCNKYTRRK